MKMSLCQTIAIFSILALGFMMAAPFVQTTDAHGLSHVYIAQVDNIIIHYCALCGVYMGYTVHSTYNTIAIHPDNQPHKNFLVPIGVSFKVCFACMLEDT